MESIQTLVDNNVVSCCSSLLLLLHISLHYLFLVLPFLLLLNLISWDNAQSYLSTTCLLIAFQNCKTISKDYFTHISYLNNAKST